MIYAVLFEDNAAKSDIRSKLMPEHLAFLERNAACVQAAGPLTNADDGAAASGLWLVTADNLQTVRALIEADPFWPTGLRKSVQVLTWHQVFARGKRLI